jgi:carbamoyl-phosphate synthase large subunit
VSLTETNWKSRFIGGGADRQDVRLLFSCAGRRIELIQAFQRAAGELGIRPIVHAADSEAFFAAASLADQDHQLPRTDAPNYIDSLLDLVEREKIDILIPLIDPELPKLSQARERFADLGCAAMISSPRVVQACEDKLAMYRFFQENGIPTPTTWLPDEIVARSDHAFPYFLKPRAGSASKGNFVIHNKQDLDALAPRLPEAIVQELAPGIEYTLDVYTGFDGVPRCVVPRRRVEVRGGEVTKSLTVRHEAISRMGVRVVEALAECVGLITIQLFLGPDDQIRVIEVNPRFGGGCPLAIHAGADFPKWLMAEWLGQKPGIRMDEFHDGILMLRYHQSFFKESMTDQL